MRQLFGEICLSNRIKFSLANIIFSGPDIKTGHQKILARMFLLTARISDVCGIALLPSICNTTCQNLVWRESTLRRTSHMNPGSCFLLTTCPGFSSNSVCQHLGCLTRPDLCPFRKITYFLKVFFVGTQ